MPNIVALVPMRHHSERVPGKNYRSFGGVPLYHHIVKSLLDCALISEIVIDTDSSVILEDAAANFPSITLLQRPQHLVADTTPMNDVLLHDISVCPADYYIQTHSTNPLLTGEVINQALNRFLEQYPLYDSLFGVTRFQGRLWDELTRALNHNPSILLRTQDLPPVFMENSCIYIFTGETLNREHSRIGKRPIMHEIDRIEASDIDEELDFRIAEFLYLQREETK